jgi:hypothetical protein
MLAVYAGTVGPNPTTGAFYTAFSCN